MLKISIHIYTINERSVCAFIRRDGCIDIIYDLNNTLQHRFETKEYALCYKLEQSVAIIAYNRFNKYHLNIVQTLFIAIGYMRICLAMNNLSFIKVYN